jgi:CheY-like chemotaxis protein
MMLEKQGYQILAAQNGHQAIEIAKSEKPDLVILDLMMPEMDGLEVAKRLRSDPETSDILIIMFTAKAQLDDKLTGFEVGADDYLTKPVQPAELIAHVGAVLKRKGGAPPHTRTPHTHRGHVVGILAAKGGVGVSTITTNLGITLAKRNRDVLVSDFRPGCGTIRLELGIVQPNGLTKLLEKNPAHIDFPDIEAEIISHDSRVRYLLSSPYPRDAIHANSSSHFEVIVQKLAYMAPVILLDLGTSMTPSNDKVLDHCNSAIVVLESIPQTVMQTRSLIEEIMSKANLNEDLIDIVLVNRLRTGIQLPFGQVQDRLGYALSVIFTPVPELAYRAQANTTPIVEIQPDGLTAEQFDSLAELVTQKNRLLA